MRILRTFIFAVGLAALAAACGGKSKAAPENTGGGGEDVGGDTGGDSYGGDAYGGEMGGEMGGEEGGEEGMME